MAIQGFTATPYDSGVLLAWSPGAGEASSTSEDICEITIQYSESDVPNIVENTPPYVVRELQQGQLTDNVLWHPNLINGNMYTYTIFVHYMDTGYWSSPIVAGPVTPQAGIGDPFASGSLSFTKLGTNTKLSSIQDSMVELVVWLPDNQESRKASIESTVDQLKPAHVRVNIVYEPYYVAHTTTAQFTASTYDSDTYVIENGTIKNKIPTIDFSFSGRRAIFGGL